MLGGCQWRSSRREKSKPKRSKQPKQPNQIGFMNSKSIEILVLGARTALSNLRASRISTSFAPIKYLNIGGTTNWSVYEICNSMGRFASRSPICDATITHCVVVKNRRKNAHFCTLSFTTQQISLVSQIGERDEILRTKLHISYIDQFVVPQIFKYLIGVKDEEF